MTAVLETTTVTVANGAELVGMLTDLASLCAKDSTDRPVLTVIRLHTSDGGEYTSGGQLHGWATDGFRAGHATTPTESVLPGPVYLYASGVKQLHTAFKSWPHELTVTINYELDTATFANAGMSLTVGLMRLDGREYPNIPSTLAHTLPKTTALVSLAPAFLETFVKIAKRRAPREAMVFAAGSPTQVRIGDSFRGWIMPSRKDAPPESDWLPASF